MLGKNTVHKTANLNITQDIIFLNQIIIVRKISNKWQYRLKVNGAPQLYLIRIILAENTIPIELFQNIFELLGGVWRERERRS